MKKINKIVSMVLALASLSSGALLASCGKKKVPNDENTLEIFITNAGYGMEWLNQEIALFKEQDWVKEKYPNLNIPEVGYNTEANYCGTSITAGPTANTVDLFFSCTALGSYYNAKVNGEYAFEDLTSIYTSTVPGENVKVKDKMIDIIYEEQEAFLLEDGSSVYYSLPWVMGAMGLFVNETALQNQLGADVTLPRTTKEFVALCTSLKGKLAPIAVPLKSVYWETMFTSWWAQYEGLENYKNFWNGVAEVDGVEKYSAQIFSQKGRLRSLQAIESLIGREAGFYHPSLNKGYDELQALFFTGEAAFMVNGDWVENETQSLTTDKISMIKTPVVSEIVETCTSINTEDQLLFIIDCVDADKAYETAAAEYNTSFSVELKETDYEHIYEARNLMNRIGGHTAHIPSYATGKEIAKDFLLFLSTNQAIEKFTQAGNGFVTPYEYEYSQDMFNTFSNLQQSHHNLLKTSVQMPHYSSFQMHYYGNLRYLNQTHGIEQSMLSQSSSDRKTAQQIFDLDKDYFQRDNEANFKTLLSNANITN